MHLAGLTVYRYDRNTILRDPAAGVHVVDGDVTISGSRIDLTGVTILATGEIKLSGSGVVGSPAAAHLPLLATTSESCGKAAIHISTSSSELNGAVLAPLIAADVGITDRRTRNARGCIGAALR